MGENRQPPVAARGLGEGALIRQLQEGGKAAENAFQQLYKEYRPRLFAFFLRRGLAPDLADDLIQETLLRVYQKVGLYQFDAPFEHWLFTIGMNVWRKDHRAKAALKRRFDLADSLEQLEQTFVEEGRRGSALPADPSFSPDVESLARELRRVLFEISGSLPPRMSECVRLLLGDRTQREIALLMQTRISTVKSHLREARLRLRPELERRGLTWP